DFTALTFLLLYERTVALVHRPERLLGGNRRADLVVVPRAPGLRRLLHLEEVHGMDLAAVGADHAFAEDRIVGRQLLHLRDDLRTVVALECLHRLEIVQHRRVDAARRHGRLGLTTALGEPGR